jgi:hypothetical protein
MRCFNCRNAVQTRHLDGKILKYTMPFKSKVLCPKPFEEGMPYAFNFPANEVGNRENVCHIIEYALEWGMPYMRFDCTSCRQSLGTFFAHFERIDELSNPSSERVQVLWPEDLLQRKLWNLQDLRDSGGLGFTVEIFLLVLRQLLSTSSSQESYSALYIGTFRAITSDRRKYKHSLGTQKILLDAVASDKGFVRTFNYPDYITDELWELLDDILEGQTGPHIDSAVQRLTDHQRENGHRYGAKASAVISRLRTSYSQGQSLPTASSVYT